MLATYAMALETFTSAVAPISPRVIAIATETNWTPWAYVEVLVRKMWTQTVFAMTPMIVSVNWMLAACATDQARFMNAVVKKCQKAIVIVTVMWLMPVENAEDRALQMSMKTAFVMPLKFMVVPTSSRLTICLRQQKTMARVPFQRSHS
jgi:hypothetical protein